MKYISRASLFFFLLPYSIVLDGFVSATAMNTPSQQQQNISITTSEGAAMKSIRVLFSAEATFQSTVGNGEYGDLKALRDANMIDKELASGVKDSYRFTIVTKKSTLTTPASIDLVARPIEYGKNSRRSFYLTESGVLMTSVEKDAALTSMRPFAGGGVASPKPTPTAPQETVEPVDENREDGDPGDIVGNEMAVITTLRAIHTAQKQYSTKTGGGGYGTLDQLEKGRLINSAQAAGQQHGYDLEVVVTVGKLESPAKYSISAVPQTYGVSGRRSFFIDQTGVLRGDDKEGGPSGESDLPVEK